MDVLACFDYRQGRGDQVLHAGFDCYCLDFLGVHELIQGNEINFLGSFAQGTVGLNNSDEIESVWQGPDCFQFAYCMRVGQPDLGNAYAWRFGEHLTISTDQRTGRAYNEFPSFHNRIEKHWAFMMQAFA
jgi:hypothetical protein